VPTLAGPTTQPSAQLGGATTGYNLTTAAVIKAAPAILARLVVQTVGAGTLTLNDCTTTGAASIANQIYSIPATSLAAGQTITLNWPCAVGLTASAVPAGGAYSLSFT
jgi:hypothetical protein